MCPERSRSLRSAPDAAGDEISRPFLKWAGGKRALLPSLLQLAPRRFATYYEPFLGGGALFFELANRGALTRAQLSDINAELVTAYRAVRDDVDRLITLLSWFQHDEKHYYAIRAQRPANLVHDVARAARTIYLNRSGYNGLYRVNAGGCFNVPFGRYTNLRICEPARLRAASRALGAVDVDVVDFEPAVASATPLDFIYLDPPYLPISPTASFTAYARGGFALEDHERLAEVLHKLGEARIPALLSNADCRASRRLYRGLPVVKVKVRRMINSVPEKRGPVGELLVRSFNYDL